MDFLNDKKSVAVAALGKKGFTELICIPSHTWSNLTFYLKKLLNILLILTTKTVKKSIILFEITFVLVLMPLPLTFYYN